MTKNEIKLKVNEIIKKYELKYPLDIWALVDKLGFSVKYVDTGDSDAYTLIINGKKRILLNKNIKTETRINFTLAHELGHYFIPSHLEPLYGCNVSDIVSTMNLNDEKVEKEADIFASELLLPSTLIKDNSDLKSFKDIIDVSERYGISIQAAAIKIIEHTDDVVCFICCKNKSIKWYIISSIFNEYIVLKDILYSKIPEDSCLNTCVDRKQSNLKDKVPAFIWIENVDDDLFIDEEVIYYTEYDTGYILIKAENLINIEDELFL